MRDLNMIGYKLWYVIIPRFKESSGRKLRNCIIKYIIIRGFMGSIIIIFNISYVILYIYYIFRTLGLNSN